MSYSTFVEIHVFYATLLRTTAWKLSCADRKVLTNAAKQRLQLISCVLHSLPCCPLSVFVQSHVQWHVMTSGGDPVPSSHVPSVVPVNNAGMCSRARGSGLKYCAGAGAWKMYSCKRGWNPQIPRKWTSAWTASGVTELTSHTKTRLSCSDRVLGRWVLSIPFFHLFVMCYFCK